MTDFERQIFGPPDDTAIIPWYQGGYAQAFIALHPFFVIEGLDPAFCEHGTLILSGRDAPDELSLLEWGDRERTARLAGKEIKSDSLDELCKRFGTAVRWRTICDETGFSDHRAINRALRTHIGGLKQELSDPPGVKMLATHCADTKRFLPTEGMLQPLMESSFVELFARLGITEIVMGDEFGDEDYSVPLSALRTEGSWRSSENLPLPFPRRLFAQDRSLLVAVHWDSFFTVILGTSERLSGARLDNLFEGFWCSETTSISWIFEPYIPLVQ